MLDMLGTGDGPTDPLRIVVGAGTREMRTALFLATKSADIRIVATASSMAELVTYARSFQPDAMIVADDLVPTGDLVPQVAALKETLSSGEVIVVGASGTDIPAAAGISTAENDADLLDELFRYTIEGSPSRRRVG